MTPFDLAVLDYLATLPRGAKAYAAHYAHHVAAGTVHQSADGPEWACTARARKQIRKTIDAIDLAASYLEDDQAAEDRAVRAEEDRIEDGQARWSETGSTRR